MSIEDQARVVVDDLLAAEPEPLRRPMPPAAPFPVEALGPTLAGAVRAICGTVQCPEAVAAGSVMMMASLAVQGHVDVRQDDLCVPTILFLLTVAQSGERKSASDKAALKALANWLKDARKDHRDRWERYAAEAKEHEVRATAAERQRKDGAGLADALLEIGQASLAPRSPERIIGDATQEGVFKALWSGCQSQALASAEGGIVTAGHSMKPETLNRWIGSLSLLWDGSSLDRLRADGVRQVLYGRRLCSHLMLQPVLAEQLLGDRTMVEQGILARFLIAWPESTVGTRVYVPRSPLADPGMQRYCQKLAELLALPLPVDDTDPTQPLQPRELKLSAGAAAAWIDYANEIEREQRPEGVFKPVQAWASKSAEQALRLAGVLTMIEDHAAVEVPAEAMERALELAAWYLGEALRLVGTASTPKPVRDAELLLGWIRAERTPQQEHVVCRARGAGRGRMADADRRGQSGREGSQAGVARLAGEHEARGMSWREGIARLRDSTPAAPVPATPATPATPAPRVAEVAGIAAHPVPIEQAVDPSPSSGSSGSSGTPPAELREQAADLLRRSGVEGLDVDDLDLDTVQNCAWFARLGTAAHRGLICWFKALAAAKRHPAGLGIATDCKARPVLVAVARRGRYSRLMEIEQEVDSFDLLAELSRLAQLPATPAGMAGTENRRKTP